MTPFSFLKLNLKQYEQLINNKIQFRHKKSAVKFLKNQPHFYLNYSIYYRWFS
ncbi:hypothetical protein HMPREF0621_0203 [Pasteurella dagmatis ATCC 43325]|uniref:Uncharacterized protein n=1 Tax=Pasteurella dagmatis ATCC 43325 TaxID=667128 RepID=C9PMH9_9PAST|nr:hypothetical protein HMPREF0621_0203 [Pasteurella dagmatis ATCC 43325]